MTYIATESVKLETSRGAIILSPGQPVKLPEKIAEELLRVGQIRRAYGGTQEPGEAASGEGQVYGCADGPGACHRGMFKYHPGTGELEWYCQKKGEWCWKAEAPETVQ